MAHPNPRCAICWDFLRFQHICVCAPNAPPAAPVFLPIMQLKEFRARAIAATLAACDGNAGEAARRLGISKATVYGTQKLVGVPVKR